MMKKFLMFAAVAVMTLMLGSCASSSDEESGTGSIYGILTEEGSAEPMRTMRIELWGNGSYMMGTVSSDDGQYEFAELSLYYNYELKVNAEGYEELVYPVTIEGGQHRRADLQLKKLNTHMTVRTLDASDLNGTSVTLNGEVSFDNYAGDPYRPKEAGFFYSTTPSPQDGTRVTGKLDGSPSSFSFSVSLSNLSSGIYYIQSYAKNDLGTAYGEIKTFEVSGAPAVSTLDATNILLNTATLNGKIDYEGAPVYSERGFVYSRSYVQPTVSDPESATTKVAVSGSGADFSANVASLMTNSTYYVRAYATNANGTVYGEVVTFVPRAVAPSTTTLDVTNILETSATLNGYVDEVGEPVYTERGFLYSDSRELPTIIDPSSVTKKIVVSGTSKEFSANVASLTTGNTYYVRTYATSPAGTWYGGVVSFKPESPDYIIIEDLMVQKIDLASSATWSQADVLCKNSRMGGYDDWRLPTLVEFHVLYRYKEEIGGFWTDKPYWASGSAGNGYYNKYYFSLYNQQQGTASENMGYRVRAVRTIK